MSSKPLLDIGDKEWHIVEAILQRYVPDREVWAFGSRAKWTAKEFSDLDLAILGEKSLTLETSAALSDAFADSDLPWKVDVVDWTTTSSSFRKIIERDKVVVQTSRNSDFVRFGDLFGDPQRNGLTRPKRVRGTGLPMVNMGELFAYPRIKDIPMDLVPVEDKELQYLLETGDLLFARQSLVLSGAGQCSIFLGSSGSTVFESHLIRCRLTVQRSNPLFYFYYFRSPEGRRAIEAIVEQGAGASGIRGSDLVNVLVPNPPKQTQDKVAAVLGALDDRISLLRETNTTLEAIAQALFKSWFVDFDPVHAKMQGRVPDGMDEAMAALFPDSFEGAGLRTVPRSWSLCPVYNLAAFINGAAYKVFEPNLEKRGLPIVKIAELKSGITATTAFSDVDMSEKYLIDAGDILFSWSGNPDTSIDTFVWHHESALLNQHIFRVLPATKLERAFVLQTLKSLRPVFAECARNKQTTGLGHVTVADMKRLLVVRPDSIVLDLFSQIVGPVQQRIFENEKHALLLSKLRDALLPRLISGQLSLETRGRERRREPVLESEKPR